MELTQQLLHETFVYEPDTGLLRRRSPLHKPYAYRGAGKDRRYLMTSIFGGHYYLHRLVFLYHHGFLPARIDHIDGDTRNNRIENLRECTNAQNQYNSKRKSNNRSGAKGVVIHANCPRKPFQAKIVIQGVIKSLGYFATLEEAAAAYDQAALEVAGPFARLNTNA